MAMLKEEFQHLKTENDVDDDLRTGKITKEEAKFLKDFLSHINFVTSEPSMHDKEVLAKAYYEGIIIFIACRSSKCIPLFRIQKNKASW